MCYSWHWCGDYQIKANKRPCSIFKMEEVAILAFSLFGENGYVKHASLGWNGEHALQYLMYGIPEWCNRKDAVAFSYGCSPGDRDWFPRGFKACKVFVVEKLLKMDAKRVKSWNEHEEPVQAANDQTSVGMPIQQDQEVQSEDSTMRGWKMGLQSRTISNA